MYRKEECLSLLKDPDQHVDNENSDDTDKTPTFKWHKVNYFGIDTLVYLKSEAEAHTSGDMIKVLGSKHAHGSF